MHPSASSMWHCCSLSLQTRPASTSPSPDDDKENVGSMSTQRCADLMVVAMANRLHEVWISTNPMLLFTYVSQYMPSTAMWYVGVLIVVGTALV